MNTRRTLTWLAVAALGVGLTTGMTITTTLLAQQPIGLSSEPFSAGNALVPPVASAPTAVVRQRVKPKPKPKPKPLAKKPHRRSPSVRPVAPVAQVLAPSPAVRVPTATVPSTTTTAAEPSSGRDGSGRGGRHSGEQGGSKHGDGGGGGGGGDD